MTPKNPPNVSVLKSSGDTRALLRLLKHPEMSSCEEAAIALASMDLKVSDSKKAKKLIGKALSLQNNPKRVLIPDPISIATYKHALILLAKTEAPSALLMIYNAWFDAFLGLLHQHKHLYRESYRLTSDSERARMLRTEAVAKRVIALANQSAEQAKKQIATLGFILSSVGNIDQLVEIDGIKFLTIEEHVGIHDWTNSRKVFKNLCNLLDEVTQLKFGFDHNKWIKLGNNIFDLILQGELHPDDSQIIDKKTIKLIANRNDLPSGQSVDFRFFFRI